MSALIHEPGHILIIRLSSLGDITHCLPVSYNLKKRYPKARVAWLVREKYRELLEMDSCLDEIITIKNLGSKKLLPRIREIFRIVNVIRNLKFDVVLDLHCALITNIIALFSDSPVKLGIDKRNELGLKWLKYCPLPKNKKTHRINAYLSILNLMGINNYEIEYSLRIPPLDKKKAINLLEEYSCSPRETIIALHPGASRKIKEWDIERFAKLSYLLAIKYGSRVIIISGPKEKNFGQNSIAKLFNSKAIFIAHYNIKELSALLEKCDLFIGNDSGPLHLAAALGLPTVSIFGPSDHLISGPYGEKHKVVRKDVFCNPCYKNFNVEFNCKNNNRNCLKSLNVEDVLKETEPMLIEIINSKTRKDNTR